MKNNDMEKYIDSSAVIISSEISESSKIYRNCRVQDSILDEDTVIGDGSVVLDSKLGKHVEINRNSMIRSSCFGDYSYGGMQMTAIQTKVGKYSSISWNVSLGGANHDYERVTTHAFLYNPNFGMLDGRKAVYDRFDEDCEIGNDVWIGAGAQILRGVKVCDGAVIGANAVVTKDVAPYAVVAGVPAKEISKRFSDEVIERLLKIRWWDLPSEMIKENLSLFGSKMDEDVLGRLEELRRSLDEE